MTHPTAAVRQIRAQDEEEITRLEILVAERKTAMFLAQNRLLDAMDELRAAREGREHATEVLTVISDAERWPRCAP